jgi:hypothetical protein
MLKAILGNKSVPRVELDQRARHARLWLEQIERLLVPRAAVAGSRLRRVRYLFSFGNCSAGSRTSRTGQGLPIIGGPACRKFAKAGSHRHRDRSRRRCVSFVGQGEQAQPDHSPAGERVIAATPRTAGWMTNT